MFRHYNYPKPAKPVYVKTVSKDAELSENLDIGPLPPFPQPKLTNVQFMKDLNNDGFSENLALSLDDPLEDILAESQAQIRHYQVLLPSQKSEDTKIKGQGNVLATSVLHQISPGNPDVMFSASHKPTEGTPGISDETSKNRHSYTKPSLQPRRLSFSKTNKTPEIDENSNRTSDPLACHAENIMRMAMDSTMLGSFCNDTISSSFSNVLDESLGKMEEKSFEDYPKKQAKSTLSFSRATKVEISAQDLEMAVSDPFRCLD